MKQPLDIHYRESVGSTNTEALLMAAEGFGHGTVVAAKSQTAGRGRNGNKFFSPAGGLYMSVILEPGKINLPHAQLATPIAAVAVCKAVNNLTGTEPRIKWVNDVLLGEKKICGILSEASAKNGSIEFIAVGVGVNVFASDFPNELRSAAGSIFNGGTNKNTADEILGRLTADEILGRLINDICGYILAPYEKKTIGEYQSRLINIGKRITVNDGSEIYEAYATGIDGLCGLTARKLTGETVVLRTGEVSVKI